MASTKKKGLVGALLTAALSATMACASNEGGTSTTTPADASAGADAGDPVPAAVNAGRPQSVRVCYTSKSQAHPARNALWTAMRANDKASRAKVIADLEAAAAELPDEEELALLTGLAHLWRMAEPLPAETTDLGVIVSSAQRAQAELERAYRLCPTDHRIPAWLGLLLINGGRRMSNQQLVEQGFAVLDKGIEHYPAFVLFSKLLAYANEPATSADFTKALDAVNANIGYCNTTSRDPACVNTFQAAHNVEGSMIFLGDLYAKAGKKSEAVGFYGQAKAASTFATWPWKTLLDERIATIDARVAAHATAPADDDPPVAWTSSFQCSVCHQQ